MSTTDTTFESVKTVVVKTLGIERSAGNLSRESALLDNVPELDSMAVLQVILAIEEHFGITIENDEVTGELFETLGTLTDFVESKSR